MCQYNPSVRIKIHILYSWFNTNDFMTNKIIPGYDINGDGKVTIKEFKRIMARTGKTCNTFFIFIICYVF